MAEITWLGHACFRIRGRDATVLMDPVAPESGYDMGRPQADIVTVSHNHPNHAAVSRVRDGYRIIRGPGEYEVKEVFVRGIRTYHDSEGGARLGKNTAYLVEMEDLVICHLGDLGHTLSEEQAEGLSAIDVLIVPVGGGPTINAAQAAEVIGQLEPSVVIPMQFRTERGDHDRDPLDKFLREMGVAEVEPVSKFSVRKADLSDTLQVVVLEP